MVSFRFVLWAHCEVMSFIPQRVAMQPLSGVHSPCGPVRELSLCGNQFLQDVFRSQLYWIIEPFLSPLASFSGWVAVFVSWRNLPNNCKLGSLKMTETEGSGGPGSRDKAVAGTPRALEEAPSFASYNFWWLWHLLTIGPIVPSSVL